MSYQYPPTSNEQGWRAATTAVSPGRAWGNGTVNPALLNNITTANNAFASELTPTAAPDTTGFADWQWPGGPHADWQALDSFDSFTPESVPAPEMEWHATYNDGGVSVDPRSRAHGALSDTEQVPMPYPKGFPELVEKAIQAGDNWAEILIAVNRKFKLKWNGKMLEDAYQAWHQKFESTGLRAWHNLPEIVRNKLGDEGIYLERRTIEGKLERCCSRLVVKA